MGRMVEAFWFERLNAYAGVKEESLHAVQLSNTLLSSCCSQSFRNGRNNCNF